MLTNRKPVKTLGRCRVVYLVGEITEESAKEVIKKLIKLDKKSSNDILLIIDSEGGDVDALVSITQVIKLLRCDVATLALSNAASAAAVLLATGTPGKRMVMSNSLIMVHDVSASLKEDYHSVLVSEIESIRLSKHIIIDMLLESGVKEPAKMVKPEPTYMLGKTAVEKGLADRVIKNLEEVLEYCTI